MTERSVVHSTFSIERVYDATPARVFAAWADPTIKRRWFAGPEGWKSGGHELDFRPGGSETESGGPPGGPDHRYHAVYWDIVPNERIVSTYEMHLDDVRISVSLATIEFRAEGDSTRLTLTEQGAYLDGYDDGGSREHGTGELLDALGAELAREVAESGGRGTSA
jgi:uncharacterized protein YndB with AHSA1/START domain